MKAKKILDCPVLDSDVTVREFLKETLYQLWEAGRAPHIDRNRIYASLMEEGLLEGYYNAETQKLIGCDYIKAEKVVLKAIRKLK